MFESVKIFSYVWVVIVGGGVMGVGFVYYLVYEGWGVDIVFLEKVEFMFGLIWYVVGQIIYLIFSFLLGKCVDYNIGFYFGGLEVEMG